MVGSRMMRYCQGIIIMRRETERNARTPGGLFFASEKPRGRMDDDGDTSVAYNGI